MHPINDITNSCELAEWAAYNGWGACAGRLTFEHIISRSMLIKNRSGKRLVEDVYPYIFGASVCLKHNAGNKCADTRSARLYLLRKRALEYPGVFEDAINELATTFTSPPPYLRIDYLLD